MSRFLTFVGVGVAVLSALGASLNAINPELGAILAAGGAALAAFNERLQGSPNRRG